jgi:RimJ/RimL family protein N-acetyltransferase
MIAETQRLILDKVTLKDASFFIEIMNSPSWLTYIGNRNIYSERDAKEHLKNGILKSYTENGFGFYKVQLKEESNKIIGICGIIKRDQLDDVDIGFAFLPNYEKKGFGYESSRAILDLCYSKFNIHRLVAITLPSNLSSIRLLEKLGMVFEKKVNPFKEDEDLLLYAIDLK